MNFFTVTKQHVPQLNSDPTNSKCYYMNYLAREYMFINKGLQHFNASLHLGDLTRQSSAHILGQSMASRKAASVDSIGAGSR